MVLCCVLLLPATACGSESAEKYGVELDKLCAKAFAFNEALPQRQDDENLTNAQVQSLRAKADKQFREDLEALKPPAKLEDAAQKLSHTLDGAATRKFDRDSALEFDKNLVSLYKALRADACRANIERNIKHIQQQPTP